jgi:hypothetical protein
MSDKLQLLHNDISTHLSEIAALFTQPPKITIVIRTPWLPDGGVLLTDDDLDEAIAEILRLKAKEPTTGVGAVQP